jgi:hypothetical protein
LALSPCPDSDVAEHEQLLKSANAGGEPMCSVDQIAAGNFI